MLYLFIFFMLEPVMDPFVAIVSHLPEVQAVTNVEARLHPKGRMLFDLYKDTGIKAQKGNEVFQYFSLYMPEFSSHELHTQLTSYIEFHCDWFEQIAGHFLQRQQLSVDQYIAKIAKSKVLSDEVCITVLSRMLGKHTCIWLQGSTWTTGLNQRVEDCVVHLVYLGNGSYGLTRELTDDEKTKLASGQSSVLIL